jgi:hypothetical protein
LADSASAKAAGKDIDQLCTSADVARNHKFSALDILADDDGKELSSDPVDWNSIMIYGSEAGGKEDGNGGREVVMTKKDGTTFGYNIVPSQKDIDAVHTIYQDSLPVLKKKSSTLFWKKGSKKVFLTVLELARLYLRPQLAYPAQLQARKRPPLTKEHLQFQILQSLGFLPPRHLIRLFHTTPPPILLPSRTPPGHHPRLRLVSLVPVRILNSK